MRVLALLAREGLHGNVVGGAREGAGIPRRLLYKLISMDASGREFYDAGLRHWCGREFWRRWAISTRARVDASSTMLAYGIDVDGSSVRFELIRPVELMHPGGQAESRLSTRSPLTRRTVAAAPMPAARPERFSVALTGGQSIAPYRSGHVAMLQTIFR